MPGCSLHVRPDYLAALPNLGGTAALPLAIPDTPALIGVEFFAQGWVPDPPANRLGVVTSNAAAAKIGRR